MAPRIRLGDLLVRAGVLDEFKLKAALAEQQRWGGRLGTILVQMNFVSEEILVKALSKQLSVPVAQFDRLQVPPDIVRKVDHDFAQRNSLCPIGVSPDGRSLLVAMADPIDITAIDEIAHRTGLRVDTAIAGSRAIVGALSRVYGASAPAAAPVGPPADAYIDNKGRTLERSRPPTPAPVARRVEPSRPPAIVHAETSRAPPPPDAVGGMVDALDAAQKKQLKAIRAMVDLLVEKGVFSREDFVARLNRR